MRLGASSLQSMLEGWNTFWFAPQPLRGLILPRVIICLVTACWFASFWTLVPAWFTDSGLLSNSLSQRLLASESISRWQQWSPLWWTESAGVLRGWLLMGIVLSMMGAIRLGGRWTQLCLWLWAIAWGHRIVVLTGILEPALMSALAYLVIQPGAALRLGWRASNQAESVGHHSAAHEDNSAEPLSHWTAGLALRLLQTHWWLLVAAGLLSQMGGLIWWRGEGVWWLAAAGRSHLIPIEMLRGRPLVVNALSHAVIAVQMLALWTTTIPRLRVIAMVAGVLVSVVYGGVADHMLYGFALLGLLSSFFSSSR